MIHLNFTITCDYDECEEKLSILIPWEDITLDLNQKKILLPEWYYYDNDWDTERGEYPSYIRSNLCPKHKSKKR